MVNSLEPPTDLPTDLTILALSAPFQQQESTTDFPRSPTTLEADLTHYRALFSKLRFSYVEQTSKERFLRGISAAEPEFVSSEANAELQQQLDAEKAALKARKHEVAEVVTELEAQGRILAERYSTLQLRTTTLSTLPAEISQLDDTLNALRAAAPAEPDADANANKPPSQTLPLVPTLDLLTTRSTELDTLNAQIASLQSSLPGRRARTEALRDEVEGLEERKESVVRQAREAKGRSGGWELRERGRWLRGVEGAFGEVVGG